jgi:hypothetical protein
MRDIKGQLLFHQARLLRSGILSPMARINHDHDERLGRGRLGHVEAR